LYTAAWKNYQEGILPIRPMYHIHPNENEAYQCPNQYTFGSELIAAPFTSPRDKDTRMSREIVWLPEGDWFDFFTAQYYKGGGWYAIYGDLHRIPVFAKAGAIVPLGPSQVESSVGLPDTLTINIFPGADNTYTLYEDDGKTLAYQHGEFALTKFNFAWQEQACSFTIEPVHGLKDLLSPKRIFKIIFHALTAPDNIKVRINDQIIEVSHQYKEDTHQLILTDIVLPVEDEITIQLISSKNLWFNSDRKKETIREMLNTFKMNSYIKQALNFRIDQLVKEPAILMNFADRMADSHILALVETMMGRQNDKFLEDPREAFEKVLNMVYHS
jgi:hypothetical protein